MTNRLLHVDCQKRFPMNLTNSMYQVANLGPGLQFHQDLEQLPVYWGRGIICTANGFYILKLSRIIQIIHSFLQLLYM